MAERVIERNPSIDPMVLFVSGATDIRDVFGPEQIGDVLAGYTWGIQVAFAICIALVGVSFLVSLSTPWKKLNRENLTGAA